MSPRQQLTWLGLNMEGVTPCVCQSSWPQRPFRVICARLQVHILVAGLLSGVCSTKEKLGGCAVTKLLSLFSFRYIKTITRGNYGRNDPTTQFFMLSFPRGLFNWLFLCAHTQWVMGNRK